MRAIKPAILRSTPRNGSTTVSFAGDPGVDGNLSKPNAPIPTHEGMKWVHTTGGWLYDNPERLP
jgi:hypothetical protein